MSVIIAPKLTGDRKAHWETVYTRKHETEVSWYQDEPRLSLEMIREADPTQTARIIDVGGGASVLVDRLLERGYPTPAVLDLSAAALGRAQSRLGASAKSVQWIVADVFQAPDLRSFDLWHDRAVFHFLTEEADRQKYLTLAERTLLAGGYLIIATFGPDGPRECSGLPVCRYDAASLACTVGPAFTLVRHAEETHHTPWGAEQQFVYALFRKR